MTQMIIEMPAVLGPGQPKIKVATGVVLLPLPTGDTLIILN